MTPEDEKEFRIQGRTPEAGMRNNSEFKDCPPPEVPP